MVANQISDNKEAYIYEKALNLPDIITEFTDIHIYHQLQSKPNFVTKHRVVSDVICLDDNENQAIANKIVMIKSSDPGFDWIFTHKIAGLVTMYGGANSHMAIRCAEFNIPAAIGCGTSIYDKLVNENTIEIDCAGGDYTAMHRTLKIGISMRVVTAVGYAERRDAISKGGRNC